MHRSLVAPTLLLLLASASDVEAQVPYNGKFYYLTDPGTIDDARDLAGVYGGYVAAINDQAEQDFIFQTFVQGKSHAYIGFSDEVNEGTFLWDSGEPVTYTNWNPGEPTGNADHVKMSSSTGLWDDAGDPSRAVLELPVEIPLTSFYVGAEPLTLSDARAMATSLGGYLAAINSLEENFIVSAKFAGAGQPNRFIGFSDEVMEGTFLWDSGDPVGYTKWFPGEPSGNGDHARMVLNTSTNVGRWDDVNWSAPSPSIIEVPYGQAPSPGVAVLDVNTATNLDGNPVSSNEPGPYYATGSSAGGNLDFLFSGGVGETYLLFAGQLDSAFANSVAYGQLDLGAGLLFVTSGSLGAGGSSSLSIPIDPSLVGLAIGLQAAVTIGPANARFSNAVQVTIH